jgi:hypothetical protein
MLSRSVAVPGGGGKAKTEKKRRKKPIGELRAGRLSFAPSRLLLFRRRNIDPVRRAGQKQRERAY